MEQYLQDILEKVNKKNNTSLEFSLKDVHARGLFSLVIDGEEHGKLTRIFIADKKLKPFKVQYHTHRYPIEITTIKGNITHHEAKHIQNQLIGRLKISQFKYRSFINGGNGLEKDGEIFIECNDYKLPIGSKINLGVKDFHTVSCEKGSIWIVEEKGFKVQESKVLGVPFTVDNLYNAPSQFQINDKCQQVSRQIKKILLNYKLV